MSQGCKAIYWILYANTFTFSRLS